MQTGNKLKFKLSAKSTPLSSAKVSVKKDLHTYFTHHVQALLSSVARLRSTPLASLLTIGVIAIALALPTTFFLLVKNLQGLGRGLDDTAQISMFLHLEVTPAQVERLKTQLEANPQIAAIHYVSPEEGLAEFEHTAGFGHVLEELHNNPLPGVIVVKPAANAENPQTMKALMQQLQSLPEVQAAELDMAWVKRLYAIVEVAKRGLWGFALLFGIAVLLIIGNTLRLAIENRRAEIEVIKLVGATDNFIRRPFLYAGVLYSGAGALFAYLFVTLMLFSLKSPIARLAHSYETDFSLQGLTWSSTCVLFTAGIGLGLLGAWIAVNRQIRAIEPE